MSHLNYDYEDAKRRVDELQDDPELKRWIAKLKAVLKAQPKRVWLFMEGSDLCVMALDDQGRKYRHSPQLGGEGAMQDSLVSSIHVPNADGGAW